MPNALLGAFGGPTDEQKKVAAWRAAALTTDPEVRIDCDGLMIKWSEYGKQTTYGWHIDHANPLALGGLDNLANLRARHWKSNCYAGGLLGSFLRGTS
jgi:hypothetical protein